MWPSGLASALTRRELSGGCPKPTSFAPAFRLGRRPKEKAWSTATVLPLHTDAATFRIN